MTITMPDAIKNLQRNYEVALSHFDNKRMFFDDLKIYIDTYYCDKTIFDLVQSIESPDWKKEIIFQIKFLRTSVDRIIDTVWGISTNQSPDAETHINYKLLRELHEAFMRHCPRGDRLTTEEFTSPSAEYDPKSKILKITCLDSLAVESFDLSGADKQRELCAIMLAEDIGTSRFGSDVGRKIIEKLKNAEKIESHQNYDGTEYTAVTYNAMLRLHEKIARKLSKVIELFHWESKKITRKI